MNPQSGHSFILTSSGNNQLPSQNSVIIQGQEIFGLNLHQNSIPVIIGNSLAPSTSLSKIILPSSSSSSSAHIFDQQHLSSEIPTPSSLGSFAVDPMQSATPKKIRMNVNEKGYFVIKSKKCTDEELPSPIKEGVLRVVIPKGTTKLPTFDPDALKYSKLEEKFEKREYLQINLSNTAILSKAKASKLKFSEKSKSFKANSHEKSTNFKPKLEEYNGTVNTIPNTKKKKLYECENCNSSFIKLVYLRVHMRSCKKPETKSRNPLLLICAYCKSNFKEKSDFDDHFDQCPQRPSNTLPNDDASMPQKKRKIQIDNFKNALQYKCLDCDRTFGNDRQYTSHLKKCTQISVHDLSTHQEVVRNDLSFNSAKANDTFKDSISSSHPIAMLLSMRRPYKKRGRKGRMKKVELIDEPYVEKENTRNELFSGPELARSSKGVIIGDNENAESLAHSVQKSLEESSAILTDKKGSVSQTNTPSLWSLCSFCEKIFLTKTDLANHMIETHGPLMKATKQIRLGQSTDEEPAANLFKCPMCELKYKCGETLVEHLLIQHTSTLHQMYKNLQNHSASFVCSMCSLVLLTKSMLIEHLSLEHLEQFEKVHCSQPETLEEKINRDKSTNGRFECTLCSSEFFTSSELISHYLWDHDVDSAASDTCNGLPVDVKIKDTFDLLCVSKGFSSYVSDTEDNMQLGKNVPRKAILIKRKSATCVKCQESFTSPTKLHKHIKECSLNRDQSTQCGDENRSCETKVVKKIIDSNAFAAKDCHFFCHNSECLHLPAFYEIKSLFKHLKEAHEIVMKKEGKKFVDLKQFNEWLIQEENLKLVRFVVDNSRIVADIFEVETDNLGNDTYNSRVDFRNDGSSSKILDYSSKTWNNNLKFNNENIEEDTYLNEVDSGTNEEISSKTKDDNFRNKNETENKRKDHYRYIEMVCHRFYSAKIDQLKYGIGMPTKKRWTGRSNKSNLCHARIHLSVKLNQISNQFDGETEISYFPQHFHSGVQDSKEMLEEVKERYPRSELLDDCPKSRKICEALKSNSCKIGESETYTKESKEICASKQLQNERINRKSDTISENQLKNKKTNPETSQDIGKNMHFKKRNREQMEDSCKNTPAQVVSSKENSAESITLPENYNSSQNSVQVDLDGSGSANRDSSSSLMYRDFSETNRDSSSTHHDSSFENIERIKRDLLAVQDHLISNSVNQNEFVSTNNHVDSFLNSQPSLSNQISTTRPILLPQQLSFQPNLTAQQIPFQQNLLTFQPNLATQPIPVTHILYQPTINSQAITQPIYSSVVQPNFNQITQPIFNQTLQSNQLFQPISQPVFNQTLNSRSQMVFDANRLSRSEPSSLQNRYVILDEDQSVSPTHSSSSREGDPSPSDEYVLPADDNEWIKLFDVLSDRIRAGELNDVEAAEAETLLSYKNLVSALDISEQVAVFQKIFALTNTPLESM